MNQLFIKREYYYSIEYTPLRKNERKEEQIFYAEAKVYLKNSKNLY